MTAIADFELTCLDDLLEVGQSENLSWRIVDRELLPDDGAVHAESEHAGWLHRLYSFQQRQISVMQAAAWETLRQIQDLPAPPLPEGSTLPEKAAPDAYELAESELMARNKVSRGQADHRLDEAHQVTGLPTILALVRAGRLPDGHARHIARTIARKLPRTGDPIVDDERRRRVEDEIAEIAPDRTTRQITYAISKIVEEIDPDAARKEHEAERTRCHVRTWQDDAGMGMLEARLPFEGVAVIDTALDLIANAARNAAQRAGIPLEQVGATHQQRRANALFGVFEAILDGTALKTVAEDGKQVPAYWEPPALPTRKRRRPHLVLRIDLPTLTGDEDWAACLEGQGIVSADLGRKIARECSSVDIVRTDSYRATARISSRIAARYRTCRFPGCDVPAFDCDDDHVDPFGQGGETSDANQVPACRRHHRVRTHGGWSVKLQPDGMVIWTSPTGELFAVPPAQD